MMISINPFDFRDKNQCAFVSDFLEDHKEMDCFLKQINYTYHEHVIIFSHTVLRVRGEHYYHIVSNIKLNEGGYSAVYPIEWDMTFDKGECVYRKPDVPVIAKIQARSGSKTVLDDFIKKLCNEYEHSKAGYLCAEKPVCIETELGLKPYTNEMQDRNFVGIMVMNRMLGIDLHEFLNIILLQQHVSGYLRLRLTLELLNSFNNQVFQKNRVHGDLKPANIILTGGDGATPNTFVSTDKLSDENFVPAWKMKIIDFEGAEYFGKNRNIFIATSSYLAPEIRKQGTLAHSQIYPAVNDEKPDLFSIGQIIALFWGIGPELTHSLATCLENEEQRQNLLSKLCSFYFENELKIFKESLLPSVYTGIACMTHENPDIRWGLFKSLAYFREILNDYNYHYNLDSKFSVSQNSTHQLPFDEKGNDEMYCMDESCIKCVIM